MDKSELSEREQRILATIEETLRQDRKLDQQLRTMTPTRRTKPLDWVRRFRGSVLCMLLVTSTIVFVVALRTVAPAAIAVFVSMSALAMLLWFDALRVRARKQHATHQSATQPGHAPHHPHGGPETPAH
jgi:hypothetical protein